MEIKTEKLIANFMEKLDHSYEYKTSNERVKIERELIDIAESELKLFAITDVGKRNPKPPKPPKDREVHLGGFSRHKRD
jgi:hypothetical protein